MNSQIKEGYEAYLAGKKRYQNPYVVTSRKHKDWNYGWDSAEEEDDS